ncbi:uncharacterized protein OCT59_013976 [Rhizophagus irregularis]|uniref:Uncharacterized protein n=2 Tax=Rhizophagus irregularis TaxID=588596 RepID=U9UE06_RHIID|nr:hypothetical protein GLOIN_2v1835445 [Rhizophagus irregularis DAOM 181602=DAOM 197198]POG80787.1 hypothetical protein GLOIN_2v1835445 [Rhizophagus irregularis DAOM 181602=DAOM 197198]UZO21589.1 hypothetical protein OCT59_013976 [Rhizophagus irregularis]|eukprot:XP_025187653.1 hypothetical protein GLOIN_2v1835445 [Rhizophagus irregularis DAOM 181602=DAOM 197198]
MANHESIHENEFKIILRSIILGLLIINGNSELILGVNRKIVQLISEFIKKFSNRRKIDSDYYLELLYIENFIENNEIKLIEVNDEKSDKIKELRRGLEDLLKHMSNIDTTKEEFKLIDEALIVNEFNLIWNNRLITGGYRAWRKKITNAIWKNEILNSDKLDDLFVYNYKKEFDWKATLEFISNRINFSSRQCGDKDARDRSYRIKNILKDLPTYQILYKRNTNKIESTKCLRCGEKEEENWEHVWICEDNEASIDEIIQESPYKLEILLKKQDKYKDIEILRDILCQFLIILESPSVILKGKSRKWELIRGIFNDNFNNISKNKEDKRIIKELWNFIYDEIKRRIWIPRCKEVKRLEEKDEIKKSDLRSKKQMSDVSKGDFLENNKNKKTNENREKIERKNINNQIKIVTLGKLTGTITDGNSIDRTWDTIVKLPFY